MMMFRKTNNSHKHLKIILKVRQKYLLIRLNQNSKNLKNTNFIFFEEFG